MSKHRRDDDPIADYIENTRYPYRGPISGGNLPKNFKDWLTPKDRRSVAISFVICAVVMLVGLLLEFASAGPLTSGEILAAVVTSGLMGLASLAMFRSARRQAAMSSQKRSDHARVDEKKH